MDYGRLNRKDLQALCKQHGIPANKTNVFMAEALDALLNASKENEESIASIPDPADMVAAKANLKRATRSKKVADVLEASEVDDLSSQLANSTLAADSEYVRAGGMDTHEAVVEAIVEVPNLLQQESKGVPEPVKIPRRARTNIKSLSSMIDTTPALVEPTLEVVHQAESTIESPASATPHVTSESRTYSRRAPKVTEQEQNEVAAVELGSATFESSMLSEKDTVSEFVFPPSPKSRMVKWSKAKGKRKVKPVSPMSVHIPEPAILPPSDDDTFAKGSDLNQMPESPTLRLTSDVITPQIQRAASISPAPGDEGFEFHPVPESFAEIMTPGRPLVEATKQCQHRLGRKSGNACKSCASQKKVTSLMQEVLQAIEIPDIDTSELEPVAEAAETEMHTPVKQGDDKENALKNIDLHSLSIRKLQKEVRRRGLSKRNNTKVKA